MKARLLLAIMVCCGLLLAVSVMLAQAQQPVPEGHTAALEALGTAFTYQGRLLQSGNPLSGTCDLQFSLWDAETGGTQVGTTQTKSAVSVSDGLFTVLLDFGPLPATWAGWRSACAARRAAAATPPSARGRRSRRYPMPCTPRPRRGVDWLASRLALLTV